jgi:mRNA-degrading endonuclease RelE of RelBE toxin-antitoxin system
LTLSEYKIKIDPEAIEDIQLATDWYNNQIPGLGNRFQEQVKTQVNYLKSNPLGYAIRYKNVRCALVRKFPFLIHFEVDDKAKIVSIYALFHTSRNPKIWIKRKR